MSQPGARDLMPPERKADGSFRYPLQVMVMTCGKWSGFGHVVYELVGYACDIEHRQRLNGCLI